MILPQIKAKLEERLGQQICSPSDCHALSIDIEKRTGQHLGVNTIKRMLGILGDEVEPRTSTLNLIAQYLGYANWNVLKLIADGEGNSDFDSIPQIITCELKVGQHVILTYEPKRKVTLKYIGDGTFCVTESLRSIGFRHGKHNRKIEKERRNRHVYILYINMLSLFLIFDEFYLFFSVLTLFCCVFVA